MTERFRNGGSDAYGFGELPVNLRIQDGKIHVESNSGPKSGSVELFVEESAATLVLNGAGSDRATVELTGPELANFRTIMDAALSKLTEGDEQQALGRNVLYSGYQSLTRFDGGFGVQMESDVLRQLDLLNKHGEIAGGARQVQCTVLGNGTAILNLAGDRGPEISP